MAGFLAREVEKGIRPSTIGRRVAAIRYAHKLAGHAVPTDDERVKATVRGIRRSLGTAPRKKTPATAERIIAMALGHRRRPEGPPRPRPAAARLRRRLPPLRAGGARLRGY